VLIINIIFRDVIACTVVSSYQCSGEKKLAPSSISRVSPLLCGDSRDFKTLITNCLTAWDHNPVGINVQDDVIPEKYVLLCLTDLVYVS